MKKIKVMQHLENGEWIDTKPSRAIIIAMDMAIPVREIEVELSADDILRDIVGFYNRCNDPEQFLDAIGEYIAKAENYFNL